MDPKVLVSIVAPPRVVSRGFDFVDVQFMRFSVTAQRFLPLPMGLFSWDADLAALLLHRPPPSSAVPSSMSEVIPGNGCQPHTPLLSME